jgi:parvulin-like peptidyl-prolyl isomerase
VVCLRGKLVCYYFVHAHPVRAVNAATAGTDRRRERTETRARSTSNPVKTYIRLTFFSVAILFAAYLMAQSTGQTQATGQAQAKPPTPPQTKAAAPPQQAKPAVKASETEDPIPPPAPNALFPAVVARVNAKAVLGRDLEQRVRAELATIGSPAWTDLREDYRKELTGKALAQLIGDELLYQKAIASSVVAAQAEIQTEFDKVAKTYPNDAALNTELANRGMDRRSLMREIGRNLVVEKYIEENIRKKLTVTPAELSDYYTKNPDQFKHPDMIRTSHILISVPDGATAEQEKLARQRAESLLERAKKGEEFAKLAKENSMDPSASQGGDIGLTENGELASEYEAAAAKLKVGEISSIVRTSYGFHIIKLTDRKKAGMATLEEVRSQLTDFLKGQKENAEVAKLVSALQGVAKIEVLLAGFKAPDSQ